LAQLQDAFDGEGTPDPSPLSERWASFRFTVPVASGCGRPAEEEAALKLAAITLAVLGIVLAMALQAPSRDAEALVDGPLVPSATSMESGGTPITIDVPLDGGDQDVTISTTGFDAIELSGTLLVVNCTPACAGEPTPAWSFRRRRRRRIRRRPRSTASPWTAAAA
jgi:hypothetical protein